MALLYEMLHFYTVQPLPLFLSLSLCVTRTEERAPFEKKSLLSFPLAEHSTAVQCCAVQCCSMTDSRQRARRARLYISILF